MYRPSSIPILGGTAKISLEDLVAHHRGMWNWIANETEKKGRVVRLEEYARLNPHVYELANEDYACEYATYCYEKVNGQTGENGLFCVYCLFDWPETNVHGYKSCTYWDFSEGAEKNIYDRFLSETDPAKYAELARSIANMPVQLCGEKV